MVTPVTRRRFSLVLAGLLTVVGAAADPVPSLGDKLVNLSVRAQISAGGSAIPGFVIEGEGSTVLIRVVGPSLGALGVAGTMSNPQLRLFRGESVLDENDDWAADPAQAAVTLAAANSSGAFALLSNSQDAALVIALEPGPYTVLASSADGAGGEVLIEVYRVPLGFITPFEAVVGASVDPESGLSGTFRLSVLASGADSKSGFLNSELDYRDHRCLTVAIPGPLMQPLANSIRANPLTFYRGKTIEVDGTAKRVTITIFDQNGDPTSIFYYQTHVILEDISDLRVVE